MPERTHQRPAGEAGGESTPPPSASRSSRRGGEGFTTLLFALLFLLALALMGWGIYLAAREVTWSLLAAGALATIAVLIAWPLVYHLSAAASASAGLSDRIEDQLRPMRHAVEKSLRSLHAVEENSRISDRAKRVAYRAEERAAIRRAIEEDLARGDFAGARALVGEMEQAFGYKTEAQRWRDEISDRAARFRDSELEGMAAHIDRLCGEERWTEAAAEADRAIEQFGPEMQVKLLRTRIEERRQTRKIELVKLYRDAVARRDVDAAMDLLRRLDTYLTPAEGQQLADSAREVFKGKLMQLRDAFREAMQRHDYSEALSVGEVIKSSFPNSQLAREVRDHEPRLREAAGVAPPD